MNGDFTHQPQGIIARFGKNGWFPPEGVITVSDTCSMEGPLLASFVQHFNHTARKKFKRETTVLLSLDGHASRKDLLWLDKCKERNVEDVVNAANTSHFLQPCYQHMKKMFHELMREIRDEFFRQGEVETTKMNFNLAFSLHAWEGITSSHITSSFYVTGLFPFRRYFAVQFQFEDKKAKLKAEKE